MRKPTASILSTRTGVTLIEVLIAIGILVVALAAIGGWVQGTKTLPKGSLEFAESIANIQNAKIHLPTDRPPSEEYCKILRDYLVAASKGLSLMQSASVKSTVLNKAQDELSDAETWINEVCG